MTPLEMHYRYRSDVREALVRHGVQPHDTTPPEFVRDFLSALYRWQLRQLRDQLRKRAFPKATYAARVIALRGRYGLLSVPLDRWIETAETADQSPTA
jgi:hypothetical protein